MVAAIADKLGARASELGDYRRIIGVTSIEHFEHPHINICSISPITNSLYNTRAVALTVMYDSYFAGFDFINNHFGRGWTLLIVATDGTKDGVIAFALSHSRCWSRR